MGLLVGGVLGRLGMLVLRLTSPETVIGITSDDGFEIGVVSIQTLNLLLVGAAVGAVNGALYAAVRGWLGTWRIALWTVLSSVMLASIVVNPDGVDFTLLEPVELAVLLTIAIPAALALGTAWLTERWLARPPFSSQRESAAKGALALLGTFGLVVAGVVGLVALAGRLLGLNTAVARPARILAPVTAIVLVVFFGIALLRDIGAVT